jgi:hypothetical protein
VTGGAREAVWAAWEAEGPWLPLLPPPSLWRKAVGPSDGGRVRQRQSCNGGCACRWWSVGASDMSVNGGVGAARVDLRWWRRAGGGARVAALEAM